MVLKLTMMRRVRQRIVFEAEHVADWRAGVFGD
ncbi:hypothetical protein DAI22_08g185800 [Oryza sativa Japonica Group]|nr:hypothetical protein DAI22_08g185800 [Oryza sativa Japonica Group]